MTHLTTTAFLYQKRQPEDGGITGRNMPVKILLLLIKIHHERVHLLVVYAFYKYKNLCLNFFYS